MVAIFTLTEANDTFPGPLDDLSQNDQIFALGGDDVVQIAGGSDTVFGGAGNDQIFGANVSGFAGEPGVQSFYGGAGNDALYQGHLDLGCNLFGGEGNGVLSMGHAFSTSRDLVDFADAGSGDDYVMVTDATFSVEGGTGNDTLSIALFTGGSVHFDASRPEVVFTVDGVSYSQISGFEAYAVQGFRQDDVLTGGSGDDDLYGDAGNDLLYGGAGNDTLSGETVYGGSGDDVMPGVSSTNGLAHQLFGGAGNDVMASNPGNLVLDAGSGDDLVKLEFWGLYTGAFAAGSLQGETGSDILDVTLVIERGMQAGDVVSIAFENGLWTGQAAGRVFFTADGFETLNLKQADTYYLNLVSGAGNDRVDHRPGGDGMLDMGAGDDSVIGGRGQEAMFGGAGNDTLLGGSGNDTIIGGLGRDYIGTGAGTDVLVFQTLAESGTVLAST